MDYVTRQFINLTKKLRRELRTLLEKQTEAIYEVTKAARDSKNNRIPVPLPVLAELHLPKTEEAKRTRRENRAQNIQIWLAIVTTGTFIAVLYYAWETHQQVTTMNSTYSEIQKQTVAIQRSAEAAAKAASAAETQATATKAQVEPVVRLSDWTLWSYIEETDQMIAEVKVQNDGQIDAQFIDIAAKIGYTWPEPKDYDFSPGDFLRLNPSPLPPLKYDPKYVGYRFTDSIRDRRSPRLFVWGRIRYKDRWDDLQQPFCRFVSTALVRKHPHGDPRNPGKSVGYQGSDYKDCASQ